MGLNKKILHAWAVFGFFLGTSLFSQAAEEKVKDPGIELFIAGAHFSSIQEYRLSLKAPAPEVAGPGIPLAEEPGRGTLRIAGIEPAVDTLVYGFDEGQGARGALVRPKELDARIEADIRDVDGPILILSDGARVKLMRLETAEASGAAPEAPAK